MNCSRARNGPSFLLARPGRNSLVVRSGRSGARRVRARDAIVERPASARPAERPGVLDCPTGCDRGCSGLGEHDRSTRRVRQVISPVRTVIDRILSCATNPAFETTELLEESAIVQKLGAAKLICDRRAIKKDLRITATVQIAS